MRESVVCPKHGARPAVGSLDAESRAAGFTVCRACWYLEWLAAVLGYGRRRAA